MTLQAEYTVHRPDAPDVIIPACYLLVTIWCALNLPPLFALTLLVYSAVMLTGWLQEQHRRRRLFRTIDATHNGPRESAIVLLVPTTNGSAADTHLRSPKVAPQSSAVTTADSTDPKQSRPNAAPSVSADAEAVPPASASVYPRPRGYYSGRHTLVPVQLRAPMLTCLVITVGILAWAANR